MPTPSFHAHAAHITGEKMRSLLFVPADSGNKLEKAFASGADAVIIDLEDSVAHERKQKARIEAAAFLSQAIAREPRPLLFIRVNGLATGLIDADLDAVVPGRPDGVVLPKAEGGAAVINADAKLGAREAIAGIAEGHIKILAQAIETPAGIFHAGSFPKASARLIGLTWGPEDLSAAIGAETNRDGGALTDPYRLARSICLFAAAAAEVMAIETVYVDFRNLEGLRRDTEQARRDGFSGRLAIHPAQVGVINDVFTPTADALAKAKAIISAFAAAPASGVVAIDGVMYDRPHLLRAERLLASAGLTRGPAPAPR
jgi:citrate lyase subunit beta / citryl-CoA lyase